MLLAQRGGLMSPASIQQRRSLCRPGPCSAPVRARPLAHRLSAASTPGAWRATPRPPTLARADTQEGVASFGDLFPNARTKSTVHLCTVRSVEFGQSLRVVGSCPEMGDWNHENGLNLKWHEGNRWMAELELPVGTSYEFKFILVHRSGWLEWEPGTNRTFQVPSSAAELQVQGLWGQTGDIEVLELEQQASWQEQTRQSLEHSLAAEAAPASKRAAAAAAKESLSEVLGGSKLQQMADAALAVGEGGGARAAAAAAVAADLQASGSISAAAGLQLGAVDDPQQQQLVAVLVGLRADMMSSLQSVESAMHEVQEELAVMQEEVTQIRADKVTAQGEAAAGSLLAASTSSVAASVLGSEGERASSGGGSGGSAARSMDEAERSASALLQSAVLSWRQEIVSFRQESLHLRHEMSEVLHSMDDMQRQLLENTQEIRQLTGLVNDAMSAPVTRVAPRRVAEEGDASGLKVGEYYVTEEELMLERFNQLAEDLTTEVRGAMQTLLDQRASISPGWGPGGDEAFPSNGSTYASSPRLSARSSNGNGSASTLDYEEGDIDADVTRWLSSHNSQSYHKGLLFCVMMAAGMWQDGLQDEIKGEAMRLTWKAYRACFSDASIYGWKDVLIDRDELLAHMAGARMQQMAKHIVWSLVELGAHSKTVQDLILAVAAPQELEAMGEVRRGGVGAGGDAGVDGGLAGLCAQMLQRWLVEAAVSGRA